MPLVLTLHRAREPSGRQRESRTLDEGSLSIGRGVDNDWVLQDPAQHLSKTHCVISRTRAGYVLVDHSSNGVFLNGSRQRIERGGQAAIADGDEFTLGDYLVRVSEVAAITSRTVTASAAQPVRGAAPAIDRDDPFGLDEFLGDAPVVPPARAPSPPPPGSAPRGDPFGDAGGERGAGARGGEPFRHDPFGDDPDDLPGRAPAPTPFGEPPAARSGRMEDPFDDGAGRGGRGGRGHAGGRDDTGGRGDAFGVDDDLFRGSTPSASWQGPSQPDHAEAGSERFSPPRAIAVPGMDDWDALLGDTPPGEAFALPAPSPPPASSPLASPPPASPPPVAAVAPVPSRDAEPPPREAEPARPDAPVRNGTDHAGALLAAFLDGAGVPKLDLSGQEPEAYLRGVGELFALMVESLREVLMSRAAVKGEFGVEQTMLRARDNNALKFSVTPADAVAALLQPGRPGYMPPMRAAREAFDDVRMHQIAVMAGVQAALFNLLRFFDPDALEARLEKGSMMESLLGGGRRAKLWDAFRSKYKEIARDADADFQTVFGKEFARAYAEQSRAR